MSIYKRVAVHTLIPNRRMIVMFQDMDGEVLKVFHCLNIMLFNYTSVMVYSLLFFMQVDYVKNIVLMLGFALNPIVFNGYGKSSKAMSRLLQWASRCNRNRG